MKNFTNNFKQFTSRLSARWLIMALMLLIGTGNASAYMCIKGTWDNWQCHEWGENKSYSVNLTAGKTYEFQVYDTGLNNDQKNNYGCDATMTRNSCTNYELNKNNEGKNCKISADITGTYIFNYSGWNNGPKVSVKYPDVTPTCETYTVAGTEGLCGVNWDPTASKNDMKCNKDGTYTITFTGISAGKHEFKICKDHGWGTAYPSDNYVYEFTEEGTYDVTITFDKNNNNSITVSKKSSCKDPKASNFTYTVPQNLVYNNETKAATVVWNGTQGGDITIYYKNGDVYSEEAPSAVGEYEVYVTTTENNNFCALTTKTKVGSFIIECTEEITKDKFSYTLPTDAKYTGNPHAVSVDWENGTTQTNGVITVYYKQGSGEYTNLAPTLAGTYTVAAKVTTAGNYCVSKNYIELGEFDISLAKQEDFSISTDISVCGATTTLSATGGSGEGDITYTIGSTNTANARIEGGTLIANNSGSVEVTATKEGEEGKYLPTSSTVTIEFTMPEAPFAGNPQSTTICAGSTFRYVADYFWYTSESGNQTVSGSATLNETTEYYISQEIKGCESARTKYTVNVDQPLVAPTLTLTNPTRCKDDVKPGSIVIDNYSNYDNSISFKLYKEDSPIEIPYENGYAISEEDSYKVEMVTTNSNVCGQTVYSDIKEVSITNNTPEATVSIADVAPICAGGSATLTCNVTPTKGRVNSYTWTLPDRSTQVTNTNTLSTGDIAQAGTYNYSVVVTLENAGCTKEFNAEKLIEVKVRPEAPNLGAEGTAICKGATVDLPRVDQNNNSNQINWYNGNKVNPTNLSVPETTTFYAEAVSENGLGCPSNDRTSYTVTVNLLPEIGSISGATSAVKYEDVELRANGVTEGAEVKWYLGDNVTPVATGTTYIVTSETAGEVIVKAKAFLNGCESIVASHTVIFSAENCESTTTTVSKEVIDEDKMEIWCREDGSNVGAKLECYAWDKNQKLIFGEWNGTTTNSTETYDGKTYRVWEINNISEYTLPIKVIFSYQEGNSTYQTDDLETGDAGHKYTYWFKKDGDGNPNKGKKETVFKKGDGYDDSEIKKTITTTTTTPAPITAPAVKIESVTTTTGLGNINFTGRVVKKGCDDTNEYGFQYSTDRQNWTTVKVGENASAGTPFSDNSVKGLDGTYYIRAYITNDHSTQTSAEKEIRLQTSTDPISNVSIKFVAAPGENNVPSAYCVGSTAYIKATYDGAKYTQFECKSDQGVTLTELGSIPNVFQFTVKGNDNIVLMLRNIYNREGEFFSNDPPLVVNATPEPTAPTISLDKSTLCSNDNEGATISLANTVVGQTYSLFKEIENDDDTQIGNDIVCTEQNKESISFNLKGLDVAGRYYVIAKENVCNRTIGTTSVTLEVVNTTGLSISIEPNTAVVTPWEPVKLKITATEGYQYNVTGLDGMVYTVNGDTYTVKIPLPEGDTSLDTDGNVIFEGIDYEISATLITGGDNQCIDPAICTITLTPYLEPCTQN